MQAPIKCCDHCDRPANTKWTLRACAEGRKRRTINLCEPCDVELNRLVLAFANVANLDSIMKKYASEN